MAKRFSAAPAARFPFERKSYFWYLITLGLGAALVASAVVAQVDPRALVQREALANVGRFVAGMFPPDVSPRFLGLLIQPVIETVQISVMGTVLATVIGLPLGVLATSSLTWAGILHERRRGPARWLGGFVPYAIARALLSVFRSIPEFVWAFMFVRAVGLGPFPGVLAIAVAYGGMLGKVYSEILEGVDPQPLEALHAGGASTAAVALYGLVPQAAPGVVSYTLYRWECAIRASAILGFVGAGGLGQQLELSMRMFQFNEVLTILAILFLLVAAVDFVSGRIRGWLT
jgi:phosphonate transport system permease protein